MTRVDSLVVTDTFGVRSLVRPIGDPALPPAFFSMWQSCVAESASKRRGEGRARTGSSCRRRSSRTLDSAPLEDVLFMRDEMANLAWAIERTVESPIEQPAQRDEAADARRVLRRLTTARPAALPAVVARAAQLDSAAAGAVPNPLQPPNTAGQILSRLKRGAVLQPDGTTKVHTAAGDVLLSAPSLLLYDEEVPREGARITRQRRLARWTRRLDMAVDVVP